MAKTIPITAEVLVWARRSCGLTSRGAAALLKVDERELATWEDQGREFKIGELRQLARRYKRPMIALVRPQAPELPEPPEQFRTITGGVPDDLSITAMLAIRDARRIQDIASEMVSQDRTLFTPARFGHAAWDAEVASEVALFERDALGVQTREQFRWYSPNQAFNAWRGRLQAMGILVLVKSMPFVDCRGFSLSDEGKVPVVVVNQRENDEAKIFTLAHEYGHLMAARTGVCLEHEGNQQGERERIEVWCNAFAGTMIAPEIEVERAVRGRSLDDALITSLAAQFNVNRPVIAIRLRNLQLVNQQFVDHFINNRGDDGWRRKLIPADVDDEDENDSEGYGRPQHEIRLSEVGFAYPKIVIGAMRHDLISFTEACDFLNIRADVLAPLEARALAVEHRLA